MSFADENPGYRIDTEEQGRNWVMQLVEEVKEARAGCDVRVIVPPGGTVDKAAMVDYQQKQYARFMIKHGGALGVIMALHRCGKIGDVAYNELRQIVINTLVPTVVAL
jgi:hypothetical protein